MSRSTPCRCPLEPDRRGPRSGLRRARARSRQDAGSASASGSRRIHRQRLGTSPPTWESMKDIAPIAPRTARHVRLGLRVPRREPGRDRDGSGARLRPRQLVRLRRGCRCGRADDGLGGCLRHEEPLGAQDFHGGGPEGRVAATSLTTIPERVDGALGLGRSPSARAGQLRDNRSDGDQHREWDAEGIRTERRTCIGIASSRMSMDDSRMRVMNRER